MADSDGSRTPGFASGASPGEVPEGRSGDAFGKASGKTPGLIPVLATPGELLDRMTTLRIRNERATAPAERRRLRAAFSRAQAAWASAGIDHATVAHLAQTLSAINQSLCDAEERLWDCERRQDFGQTFVATAREIMQLHDRRMALKGEVSEFCGWVTPDISPAVPAPGRRT